MSPAKLQSVMTDFYAWVENLNQQGILRGAQPLMEEGKLVTGARGSSVTDGAFAESKEAIADYDEIRKEIKLALQECGRRLGVFLRRRERAKGEFRRRNIFELYIEEVVEACARLKGGKLPKEKLKAQLQKIAMKRTGGAKTDQILRHDSGPEGLPHSIIVTPEGAEGEAPMLPEAAGVVEPAAIEAPEPDTAKPARGKTTKAVKARGAKAKSTKAATATKRAPKAAKRKAKPAKRK